MQPAGGMMRPPMAPLPMDQHHQIPLPMGPLPPQQQQPWPMMSPAPPMQQAPPPPQYQRPPQAMWSQQLQPLSHLPVPSPPAPPQYQAQIPVQAQHEPVSPDEIRTLWIGDLQNWMNEAFVSGCFARTGEVVSVKLIRDKQTGQLEGYGFIEFATRATAERVLQTYNGTLIPNTDQAFRLNWASFSEGERRGGDDGADYTIFVGDLAADVSDYMLQKTFKSNYPSVKGAKVVTERTTGRSKGYGFVMFGDANEQARAMTEMHGVYCSSRPMRTGAATAKKAVGGQLQYSTKASYQNPQGTQYESDPDNTTIFVGGLDLNVSEEELHWLFSTCGELVQVKIPVGKGCGFVQFANRQCAEEAKQRLNGTLVRAQNIRLSWGRSPSNKQAQQQGPNQWSGGNYYGYGQGYDATYAYSQQPQDPNEHAYGGSLGYTNYQQQQANYQQQQ